MEENDFLVGDTVEVLLIQNIPPEGKIGAYQIKSQRFGIIEKVERNTESGDPQYYIKDEENIGSYFWANHNDISLQATIKKERVEISRMEKYLTIKRFLQAERRKQVDYATESAKRKYTYVGGRAKKAREKAEERIVYIDELLDGWREDLKISVEEGTDL